jgi:hypothetical protein
VDEGRLYWEPIYEGTGFEVPELGLTVRIGQTHPSLDHWLAENGCSTFAIITGWNPMSEQTDETYNTLANIRLLATLNDDFLVLPALGVPDEGDWEAEDSFLVAGISENKATQLAKAYRQRAFVFGLLGQKACLIWP